MNIACSWSGGKDSCYALMLSVQQKHTMVVLLNMMNEAGQISRSHGLTLSLLKQQASAMNIPLIASPASWENYESIFVDALKSIQHHYSVEGMVFGDIDLQAHRDWEEMVCYKAELKPMLPLWKMDRNKLVTEMLQQGIVTMIVSCNTHLGPDFLGLILNVSVIEQLEERGVDVCGENGEFHTLVIDCPLFSKPVDLPTYEKVMHNNYWFIQWH